MNLDRTEQEFKWMLPERSMAGLAAALRSAPERSAGTTVRMEAIYYDTPDQLVYRSNAALRLRRENGKTVCCMKRTLRKEGALAVREEYETEAADLYDGLRKLPSAGAPETLCLLLQHQQFRELAHTAFIRSCSLLTFPAFTAEIAIDVGRLGGDGHWQDFEEIELERKSGDAAAFCAWGAELQARFGLIPQPLSKLARAIKAAQG